MLKKRFDGPVESHIKKAGPKERSWASVTGVQDGDPRAKHLREMSRQLAELTGDSKWYEMSRKIEALVEEKKGLKPNVDFYSASVYNYLGIPSDLFTPIFAMSRVTGWTAHVMEQYANNRLIRPRAEYVGPKNQPYVPIDQR